MIKNFFRNLNAGTGIILFGWIAYYLGGNPAYRDYRSSLDYYVKTGISDTSWVSKYIK